MYKLDVKSVFLHSDVNEDVYVKQPIGYVRKGEKRDTLRI